MLLKNFHSHKQYNIKNTLKCLCACNAAEQNVKHHHQSTFNNVDRSSSVLYRYQLLSQGGAVIILMTNNGLNQSLGLSLSLSLSLNPAYTAAAAAHMLSPFILTTTRYY